MTDDGPVSGVNRPPKFFDVATDPCDNNPFTAEDPRHRIWRRATRRAEEQLCKLAELMPVAYKTRLENEWKRVESELTSTVGLSIRSPCPPFWYRTTRERSTFGRGEISLRLLPMMIC